MPKFGAMFRMSYCNSILRASVQALSKYSGRETRYTPIDIRTVHYIRIGENRTFWNTLLSLSCIFKQFQFQDCNDKYFMHLIIVLFIIKFILAMIKQMQHFNFYQVRRF